MSMMTRLGSLAAVLAVVAGAAVAGAAPAAAKSRSVYNQPQNWEVVDKNRDGDISKKEWAWAEKHGYDRLNGVPKKHLTRKEYQAYLNTYLGYRQSWNRYGDNDYRNSPYDRPYDRVNAPRDWWQQQQNDGRYHEKGGGYGRSN